MVSQPTALAPLHVLQTVIEACRQCSSLRPWRKFRRTVYGNAATGCLLVGEAPGRLSWENGRRFTGPAGQLIRRALSAVGHPSYPTLEDLFYLTDVVKCHPGVGERRQANRTPQSAEVRRCLPFLRQELDVLRPTVIVTFGKVARQAVERALALQAGGSSPQLIAFPHPSPRNLRTIRQSYASMPVFEAAIAEAFRTIIGQVELTGGRSNRSRNDA